MESSRSISEGTENSQLKSRGNSAKVVVGLTVGLLISYVPYHAFWTHIIFTSLVISSDPFSNINF